MRFIPQPLLAGACLGRQSSGHQPTLLRKTRFGFSQKSVVGFPVGRPQELEIEMDIPKAVIACRRNNIVQKTVLDRDIVQQNPA
ncbi:hypothetical protein D3C81_774060 [compost metagenome]